MTNKQDIYALIMAGGTGSRFWPLSTEEKPKQFLDVLGVGKSLLRLTFERLIGIANTHQIFVLTNVNYKSLVLEQLPELKEDQIICEPERKNTAPCIAFAAAKIFKINRKATLVVAPSDHLILNKTRFEELVQRAILEANANQLVTLGIQPTRPDTGFGYIEIEKGEAAPGQIKSVVQFREKPSKDRAIMFLESGNYFWNSGIFIWRAEVILDALKAHCESLYAIFFTELSAYNTPLEIDFMERAFAEAPDISIDFAVMEHAKNVSVVLSDFDWSDLGTWGSLLEHLNKDKDSNAIVGDNVFLFDTHHCLVHVPNQKKVLLEGLENMIVVENNGMLMIMRKEREPDLKKYLHFIQTNATSSLD